VAAQITGFCEINLPNFNACISNNVNIFILNISMHVVAVSNGLCRSIQYASG